MPSTAADSSALARLVASNPAWYHTIELPHEVTTPGVVDLRSVAPKALPERLDGCRALDIGTFDGFWAFEMERRGGSVLAIDIEAVDDAQWPPANRERLRRGAESVGVNLGTGFAIASEALGSNVTRVVCNVLDLTPQAVGGPVDFAFCGALLLHLRDPVQALERILDALRPGGRLVFMEPFSGYLTIASPRRPVARFQPMETSFNWWVNNLAGLRALAETAGFTDVERLALVRPPSIKRMKHTYAVHGCSRPAQ